MDLVGQMYKLSACFDTPNEYKGLPYDYFPEEAVTYGSTVCSFGLPYNDHNYGMPIGLTPPVMAPHLMDPVPKPKKTLNSINPQWTKMESRCEPGYGDVSMIKTEHEVINSTDSSSTCNPSSNSCTPRKQYLDENDYPVYVEPEIKVVEVPSHLCVSASEYSDCSTESSDDEGSYNPEFIAYLKSLPKNHQSVEKYLEKAKRKFDHSGTSQKSSGSEKKESLPPSDFIIDCICEYCYDDKRMVQCESCGVRQHIDCMYTNPRQVQNFLKHRCHKCSDIAIDISRAKAIQQSRKSWHLTADRFATKNKFSKYDEHKRLREFTVNFREIKTDRKSSENSKFNRSNNNANNSVIGRVNKRKQDLKACITSDVGRASTPRGISDGASSVSSGSRDPNDILDQVPSNTDTGDTIEARITPQDPPARDQQPEPPCLTYEDANTNVHTTSSNPTTTTTTTTNNNNNNSENTNVTNKHTGSSSSATISNNTGGGLINHRRSQPLKKDYKEAYKSLYSTKLLNKVNDYGDDRMSSAMDQGLDQGSEFLDRNPRCRIVIFDSCTMGIEASVRLQPGSIVSALFGKMMLMDEYLACTNPTTEFRPYVFLYHNFSDKGLVIDCSNYGNITRYLRRSCDPNVKLEHMIIGGTLYVVIRTATEVFQGVELTMPFDVPFELCQYAVQCACGKVRCPAVKHRRKHHRSRVIPTNINCEQVIEDKLRELSLPLSGSPGTGGGGGGGSSGGAGNNSGSASANQTPVSVLKKMSGRFGLPARSSPYGGLENQRQNSSTGPFQLLHMSLGNKQLPTMGVSKSIKLEEIEPQTLPTRCKEQQKSSEQSGAEPTEEVENGDNDADNDEADDCEDDDSVKTTPSKQNDLVSLTAQPIVSGKRQPKPIRRPDFEMDFDSHILHRQTKQYNSKFGGTTSSSTDTTPIKMKKEPIVKSQSDTNSKNIEGSFKSIITTRRQKCNNPSKIVNNPVSIESNKRQKKRKYKRQ